MENMKTIPAAEKLKKAIEEYGKDKVYNELPEDMKDLYKPASFFQKVTRLKDYNFFTDSKLLFEVLRILGISFESLFSSESEESKIAFYLNKINDNIAALRTEQQLNNWFENNAFTQKTTPRSTLIIKLDAVFSIWYINLFLIPAYIERFHVTKINETLYIPDLKINIFPHNVSELLSNISYWCQNIYHFNPSDLFMYYYKKYSLKDRPKLNKLYALIGNNTNTQYTATPLSFLGINYILINNIQNYFKACNNTPFYDGTTDNKIAIEIYKNLKDSLSTILKKFDEVIEFIEIRSKVSIYQDYADAISDSIEQLISVENFITNIFPGYMNTWKKYTEDIENKNLQKNESQVKNILSIQNEKLLSIIKELKKIDLRSKGNEEKAISLLRFSVNEACTSSPFGLQLVTPMTKLNYEKYVSELLESTKIRVPKKDSTIHFENRTIGFLERYKSYQLKEVDR